MTNIKRPKVAVILLDSTDAELIEQGIAEGWLPNLADFRKRGGLGRLNACSDWVNASPWPSFLTGQNAGDHGVWNYLAWDPQKMSHTPCSPDIQNFEPFWRTLCKQGHRCVTLDVPRSYPPKDSFDGVEFSAWGSHYKLTDPYSNPPEFLQWVNKEIGKEPLGNEPGGALTAPMLLTEYERIIQTTKMQCDLAIKTLQRESCELFIVTFSGPHRGGHMLWDCSGLAVEPTEDERKKIDSALREIYIETDKAFGRVVNQLGNADDTTTIALSLHGMGGNTELAQLLPQMLDCILHDKRVEPQENTEQSNGLLSKVREAVPLSFRNAVKNKLPKSVQHQLTMFWRKEDRDWSTTRAFTLMADLQGFVRINLKGRESQGIVEPGQEYDELCAKIIEGLKTFKHRDTGESAVADAKRADGLFPDGDRLSELPDIIVNWAERPVKDVVGIISNRYGTINWPTPGRVTDGRCGHHRHHGWMAAVGRGIPANSDLPKRDGMDIPPTLCEMINAPIPSTMTGRPIDAIIPHRAHKAA